MTKRVLADHGLRAATSLGLTLDADISSEDKEVVAKGAAALEDALRFSAEAGAQHMCGILYSALAKYPGPPTAAGRANAAAALRSLACKAEDSGVALCLEVVNRYETNLLNTVAQAAEFVDEINHPNVFIHLDTYHAHIEEVSMAAAVAAAGRRLRYIHIGESHRGYLGTGSVDFQGLFEALAASGYSGPITFESFSSAVVSESLSNTLCVWRDLWSDSSDLVRHARDYIDVSWRAALVGAKGYQGAGRGGPAAAPGSGGAR